MLPAGVGPCEKAGGPGDVPAHDPHLQGGGPHQGGSPCLQGHAQVLLLERAWNSAHCVCTVPTAVDQLTMQS